MRNFTVRLLAVAALAATAVACSSGGGSGGGGGGGLAVTPTAKTFSARQNGPVGTATQRFDISISSPDAAYVGYAFSPSQPSWLSVGSLSGSGTSWSLTLSASTTTSLPVGTYTTTLRVGIGRADQTIIAIQDVPITYTVDGTLTVSPQALTFRKVVGGPDPALQLVAVGASGMSWTASASAPWILLDRTSGTGSTGLQVGANAVAPALDPGAYVGTITVARTGTSETAAVGVSLTVEAPALVTSTSVTFAGVNGAPIATKSVAVSMNNGTSAAWTATADQGWVVLSQVGATTPGALVIGVDPSQGPLASGAHSATITVTTSGGSALTTTIPVQLALTKAAFAVTPATVALGGVDGRDTSPRSIQIALGTGATSHAWSATATGWITLGATSGTTSATATPLVVGVDAGLAGAGTHQGAVELAATVNGDYVTTTVPVTVALDQQRLVASDRGIAFASMPGLARLSRTLRVRDVLGLGTTWTASADAGWLSVSHGGVDAELVVTADPTGLTTGTVHEALVTITPDVPGPTPETVRIGFWVNDAAPPANRNVAGAFTEIEGDPIRPYAYVHAGGTDVSVYNVFTGELVRTFSHVAPAVGAMAASTDGSTLYVADETNLKVIPVDLASGTIGAGWSAGASPGKLVYARTDGKDVLIGGPSAHAWDAATGALLDPASPAYLQSSDLRAVSVDGSRYCATSTLYSPHEVYCQPLGFSTVTSRVITGAAVIGGIVSSYGGDLAVSPDGARAYHQGGVYDAVAGGTVQTMTPNGRSLEATRDGRVVAGSYGAYATYDLFVRDAAGYVLSSYKIAGYSHSPADRLLKVTGDGLCVAAITDDPKLVFQVIGP